MNIPALLMLLGLLGGVGALGYYALVRLLRAVQHPKGLPALENVTSAGQSEPNEPKDTNAGETQ
jgi:hypothetical protein